MFGSTHDKICSNANFEYEWMFWIGCQGWKYTDVFGQRFRNKLDIMTIFSHSVLNSHVDATIISDASSKQNEKNELLKSPNKKVMKG